ncbi:M14 family zinc carboxypeptidase [Saccharopolyspora sp. CA-218241]|uniref:M14 family zinc carboxypeptidase n=1 Tax=Saccharopolyspora sp. CA-218241 TaxID=3240027 RepID=UPI003D97CA61
MRTSSRRTAVAVAAACLTLAAHAGVTAAAAPAGGTGDTRAIYAVPGTDVQERTAINRTGALVLSVSGGEAVVEATPEQAERMRAAGLAPQRRTSVAAELARRGQGAPGDFPPEDRGYHNYDEVVAELGAAVADHPDIATLTSAGTSHEGRDIPVLKISDNAGQDEAEPEVLFDCNQHAREHLTTEMCLRIVERFTDGYATDPAIAEMVDSRELWVIPVVNPDGSIHDVASGQYLGWRKNRQGPGTDLNRNWGHKWGCCGGSSGDPNAETYRGTEAWSAPETAALRDFIDSRVVGGEQQIEAAIDFHTYSELVLWPFGYTTDQVTEGMTQEQYDRFERVGTEMARTNGYTPQQASGLYITDGGSLDWMWAEHGILAFTFEMYPAEGGGLEGFYPPDEVIAEETARNDEAVDVLIREAGV